MSTEAPLIEIFSSFQGEGTHVGERHLFVRFQDCDLSCQWCDTPATFVENKFCRLETPAFSKNIRRYPNPISVSKLNEIVSAFDEKIIAVTGGEPLQKVSFLTEWLPTVRDKKILLETAGVHFSELEKIIGWIEIVSMDMKLPSSTGMKAYWEEHEKFLRIACRKEVYVKVVVTRNTKDEEVREAAELVAAIDASIPFILQPASVTARFKEPSELNQLHRWEEMAQKILDFVRVIPQVHKQMGVS